MATCKCANTRWEVAVSVSPPLCITPTANGNGDDEIRQSVIWKMRSIGDLTALRYDDWKLSFKTFKGNLFTGTPETTNVPIVTNLRQDPWERYQDQSMMYARWWGDKLWTMVPGVTIVGQFLATFREYPPSQRGGTLSIERALEMVQQGASGPGH